MQTKLSAEFEGTAVGRAAESILRSCVHCGFCNATCPTYQLLGDELDGPRGRIYLIKQLLEGGEVGRGTQLHLDRCLTCLNCETTCPSGVEYGKLVTIGRELVEARVPRPWHERLQRWVLKEGLTSPLFGPLVRMGRAVRTLLPRRVRSLVGTAARTPGTAGAARASVVAAAPVAGSVLLLAGCVQRSLRPNLNEATLRVLAACGIRAEIASGAGCCGALREHLADGAGAREDARRNIDAWWPSIDTGAVAAVVSNASACGLAVKHYDELLADDPAYAAKARRVAAMAQDVSELMPLLLPRLQERLGPAPRGPIAVHVPCTLQHGQRLGGLERHLAALGWDVRTARAEGHLCCGSAGTYSVLQPLLAQRLRDRKLQHLMADAPTRIVSANIGCIQHLQSGTALPVQHWIEAVDEALQRKG